jgi:hypothetical protein
MSVSERARESLVGLLLMDVEATIGLGHEAVVRNYAATGTSFGRDPLLYRDKLVEDVQQYFHDTLVDTTWPACPRHRRHPLWLRGEFWYCEQDDVAVARLGELRSIVPRRSEPK